MQLKEKKEELKLFAKEYFNTNNIDDIVCFDDIGLNITLSASMKTLKEQIIAFCEKISSDLKLIELEEYKDEILIEYKNNLDFTKSKLDVINRHKQLEELQKKNQEQEIIKQEENIEKIEEIITPSKEIANDKDIITCTFTITGTREQIMQIEDLLIELGVEYK